MDDRAFLKYALEQAFCRPVINPAAGVNLQTDNLANSLTFKDSKHPNILAYSLPHTKIKKYVKHVDYDTRHCMGLYAEYDIFKHDWRENIIIPEDYPEVAAAKIRLDMLTVSRQSAQKKRICARIIPADFHANLEEISKKYEAINRAAEQIILANPNALNISLLEDFAAFYRQTMRFLKPTRPFFWLNKKRMNYYLNEIAQILKSAYPITEDFLAEHKFWGESFKFAKRSAQKCQNRFHQMVFMLQKMAHEPALLTIVQILLADNNKYLTALNQYKTEKKVSSASEISALRHDLQKIFEAYAFLQYLDGVRFAFENNYLNECPETHNQALPTVSPQQELKKIEKIVAESKKLNASNGRIAQIYIQALQNYKNIVQEIEKLLKKV